MSLRPAPDGCRPTHREMKKFTGIKLIGFFVSSPVLSYSLPVCHNERMALMETLFLAKSTKRLRVLLMHAYINFMKE